MHEILTRFDNIRQDLTRLRVSDDSVVNLPQEMGSTVKLSTRPLVIFGIPCIFPYFDRFFAITAKPLDENLWNSDTAEIWTLRSKPMSQIDPTQHGAARRAGKSQKIWLAATLNVCWDSKSASRRALITKCKKTFFCQMKSCICTPKIKALPLKTDPWRPF